MWQIAEQENQKITVAKPVTQTKHKPVSMWQMAQADTVKKPAKSKRYDENGKQIPSCVRRNILFIRSMNDYRKALESLHDNDYVSYQGVDKIRFSELKKIVDYYTSLDIKKSQDNDVKSDEDIKDFYEFGNHKNQRFQHHPKYLMDGNGWKKYARTLRNKSYHKV